MERMVSSIEAVAGKFPENVNINAKMDTEFYSVIIDEVHVKQEVNEEPLKQLAPGSPNDKEFHNNMMYEVTETSQSALCKICWTYCNDAEGFKNHLKTSPECNQYENSSLVIGEDSPVDNSQEECLETNIVHTFDGISDVDRCTDAIDCRNQNDSTSNMKSVVEPFELNTNINSSSTEQLCNKSFTQKGNTNEPKLKHTGGRQFSCDVCNQTFTRKSNLNTHKLIHTGERPFYCDICYQTFTQKGHLNTHKLKHTGERQFTCDVCNQTFALKYTLNRHKIKHTGERQFSCDMCDQTFTQKCHLNTHKLIHTGGRQFACDVCNQTFNQKYALNRHKLTHTGVRPFTCEVCNQTFTQKYHLNNHMLLHTGKPFCCDMCLKSYTDKRNLVKHIRSHNVK